MMNHEAGQGDVRMKKLNKMKAGQGDVAARSIDDESAAGHRWAFPDSRSRDARTAVSLTAILLPRDARAVIFRTAESPQSVKAQLPLADHLRDHQEVAGSLPLTMKLSAGPYDTSCSLAIRSHESLTRASLALRALGTRVTRVTPPPCPPPVVRGDLAVHHRHHRSHPSKVTTVTVPHHGGH